MGLFKNSSATPVSNHSHKTKTNSPDNNYFVLFNLKIIQKENKIKLVLYTSFGDSVSIKK